MYMYEGELDRSEGYSVYDDWLAELLVLRIVRVELWVSRAVGLRIVHVELLVCG